MPDDAAAARAERGHDEQLRRDLADASEQFAATSQILSALGRSTSDPDVVLTTIVDSARRLCHADALGAEKHLVATDHFEDENLKALSIGDLFDIVARNGLHFHQARQTGVVFHMISSLTEHGRIGLTAVGNSRAEATEIYERAQRVLHEEARAALEETPIPVRS